MDDSRRIYHCNSAGKACRSRQESFFIYLQATDLIITPPEIATACSRWRIANTALEFGAATAQKKLKTDGNHTVIEVTYIQDNDWGK